MTYKVAVLTHGCHLQADLNGQSWEDIVWGFDQNWQPTLSGRGTMGLKVAMDEGIGEGRCLLILSTGASERDGMKEGEFTREFALNRVISIARSIDMAATDVYEQLTTHCELDLESQNTTEECTRNFRRCAELGIEKVILVSSPWHIQRCHTEALKVADKMRRAGETVPEIVAMASHGSTEGIVMLEPPHRGDRPKTIWHSIGVRLFRIPEDRRVEVESRLNDLLAEVGA